MQQKELVPGLAGVPAAESAISYIDGQEGILDYRGIPVQTLAEKSTYEETAYLLLHGELPTRSQLSDFRSALSGNRDLPEDLVGMLEAIPRRGHPMNALQAGLAGLGMVSDKVDVRDADSRMQAILRILGATVTIIATIERARAGQRYLAPDRELDTPAIFLHLLNGEKPDELKRHVLDVALILHADHTMNASTFTARVVGSTEADPYTVCSSALGALFGPLHGGANERVLAQLESIGSPENVRPWVEKKLAEKGRIFGFGHRVYKTKDPRATALQGLVRDLFAKHGSTPIYDIALELEQVVVEKLGERGIHPNVDFFSGIVYEKLGIKAEAFTPIFALSRVAGYLAHWHEQMSDNKLFRPGQVYTGRRDVEYVELDAR